MYRPTVRYDECVRKYVDELFQKTSLDRNQILRLAIHVLHENNKDVLKQFLKTGCSLPSPDWDLSITNNGLWYGKPLNVSVKGVTSSETEGVTSTESEGLTSLETVGVSKTNDKEVFINVQENSMERLKRKVTQSEGSVHKETSGVSETTIVPGTGIKFSIGGSVLLPRR